MKQDWLFLSTIAVIVMSLTIGAQADTVVHDSAGRPITIEEPLTNVIVLSSPAAELIRALNAEHTVVGISQTIANDGEYWPVLSELPVVSTSALREPDLERIVQMSPQAVITYGTHPAVDIEALAAALEPAGVLVIGLDGYRLDSIYADVVAAGRLFGAEESATMLLEFFDEIYNAVDSRAPKQASIRVYPEAHSRDYRGHGQDSEWHAMIERVGASNILADIAQAFADVDPERLVRDDPDVILKEAPRGLDMGYGTTDETSAAEALTALTNRVGWNVLQAVQNERIYIISTDLGTGPGKVIAHVFLARLLYPDEFADLEPYEYLEYYYRHFQGLPISGIFVYPKE